MSSIAAAATDQYAVAPVTVRPVKAAGTTTGDAGCGTGVGASPTSWMRTADPRSRW